LEPSHELKFLGLFRENSGEVIFKSIKKEEGKHEVFQDLLAKFDVVLEFLGGVRQLGSKR